MADARKISEALSFGLRYRPDAAGLELDGHVFRLSGKGVWLTDHVPPGYIARLDDAVRA